MLIDSHCHLDRIDLKPYQNSFANFMTSVKDNAIEHLLCIAIDLEAYPKMLEMVESYPQISVTVGVHPKEQKGKDPSTDDLLTLGQHEKVIGIGETGLDYYHSEGDLTWQHNRFRNHIRAAKILRKPLIIHTREAKEDTLKILQEENAAEVGGIIHCFTEDWEFAQRAMALNFYISFSGIVTFKNAQAIQDVAKKISADRYLIETDSPYLAPIPFRGKTNYPIYVKYVAQFIADLRDTSYEQVAWESNSNFKRLFKLN